MANGEFEMAKRKAGAAGVMLFNRAGVTEAQPQVAFVPPAAGKLWG